MIECLHRMGKEPKIIFIFTDDENALSKESIQTYLREQKIEHHRTKGTRKIQCEGDQNF